MVVDGVGVGMFIERRMTEEMDNWWKEKSQPGADGTCDDDSTYRFSIGRKPPAP